MTASFIHIGKFVIDPANRGTFVEIMREYDAHAVQNGLDHSHVIEDENAPGTFMHITVWRAREDWVEIEKSEAHLTMHKQRDALLTEPMEHDFVCGRIEI